MNCCNKGGNVFLIMFKTGHALLLPGGRFLSPRSGRGLDAECPRHRPACWPWPCPVRDRVQSETSPHPCHARGRVQSGTVSWPCPQPRPQSVPVRVPVRAEAVRDQSTSAISGFRFRVSGYFFTGSALRDISNKSLAALGLSASLRKPCAKSNSCKNGPGFLPEAVRFSAIDIK